LVNDFNILENDYNFSSQVLISSFYAKGVKRYLKLFGKKQVKIVIFEEFIGNTQSEVIKILKFLGVKDSFERFEIEKHNPFSKEKISINKRILNNSLSVKIAQNIISRSNKLYFFSKKIYNTLDKINLDKTVTKPAMSENDRMTLQKIYQDDVKELEKILNLRFPWPNFTKI